jgi:hypothetical protein
MRFLAAAVGIGLTACAGAPFPQVKAGVDPRAQELFLLAYDAASARYLVLERTLGQNPRLQLWLVDPAAETRTPYPVTALPDLARRDPLTPALAILAVRGSAVGRELEARGYLWPEVVPSATLTTDAGALSIDGDLLQLHDGSTEVALARLSPTDDRSPPVWLVAPDTRRVGLSLRYDTTPAARDLRVVDLTHARALLLSTRAYEAHAQGDFERALGLWYEALALAPELPETLYNLACAHARMNHGDTALRYLAHAIATGGGRFRSMARVDADLAGLRGTSRFREVVDRLRPGRD